MRGTIDFARDDAVGKRADELMATDPELVKLARTSSMSAFRLAIERAIKETSPTAGSGSGAPAMSTLTREKRAHEVALAILHSDPDLKALAEKNYPAAFKRAHRAADAHYLVTERARASTVKPGTREELVHRLALTLLAEQPSLRDLDRSDPGKAFDQAMAEAEIHYPVNHDGTDGMPTRVARAAEISWLTDTPLPSDALRDERARAAIGRQGSDARRRVLKGRVDAIEERDVPMLQPGEPRMVTPTKGPDGRTQWSVAGRRAGSPAGLKRT